MRFELFSDYPSWFWFLCFVAGAAYAIGLYYREKKIGSAIENKWMRRLLSGLRFLAVAILAFLLMNPYLRSKFNQTERPVVIVAEDNSSSVITAPGDSAQLNTMISNLQEALKGDFDVRTYTFGTVLKENKDGADFSEKNTDISSAISDLNNLYENLNVGAIILSSDGIYNTGSNPVYTKNELGAPIYTIALGDTVPKKDVRIARVLHNNIVYLKDQFTLNVDVDAIFCKGNTVQLSVAEISGGSSRSLSEQPISITSDRFQQSATIELKADAPGIRHFRVRVSAVEGEHTLENNISDIYIEVLDARQKILLLANSPHPDLNAITESILSNQNYDVDMQLAGNFNGNVADYDMVILHQLPSAQNAESALLNTIRDRQIPVWFIVGSQTALPAFNGAQRLVKITSGGQSSNEVTAVADATFNLFTVETKTMSVVPKLPALESPYGQYTATPASQILLRQKIGSVTTKDPLLLYSLPGTEKTAVLCGENFWKWRLYDYVLNTDQEASNELVSKTIQYLSAKNDKKQFRVSQAKNVLNENEPLIFDGELYNDSYELVNEPDATLTIKNEKGDDFPFQFTKTEKRYTLNAGYFPEGNYTYTAGVVFNGKEFKDQGAFSISPVKLETLNTTANHQLLNQIAVQSGGKMVSEKDAAQLADMIRSNAKAKPVMREIVRTQSIINLKWIFFVLLGLLSMEWFVRKYNGGY